MSFSPVRSSLEQGIIQILCPSSSFEDIENTISRVVGAYQQIQQQQGSSQFDIQVHEEIIAPEYICTVCTNQDQTRFVHDKKSGDTICMGKNDEQGCGNVVHDHKVFEGNMYRKFEDKEDRSHHGPAPNRFFSNPHNLKTSIEGQDSFTFKMRQLAEHVEMNLSQMGTNERRTRIGYKDQMKHRAFSFMEHVAANLSLHQQVVATARELFATFRDEKENVCNFHMVVASCLIYACRQAGDSAAQISGPIQQVQSKMFSCNYCNSSFSVQKELRTHNCMKKNNNQQDESKSQRNQVNNTSVGDFRNFTSKDFSHVPMEQWDLNQVSIWLDEKTLGKAPEYTSRVCLILKNVISYNVERKARSNNISTSTNTRKQRNTSPPDKNHTPSSSSSSSSQHFDMNKMFSMLPTTVQKAKTPGQILLVLNQNHFTKICQNQEVAKCIFNAIQQFKFEREKRKRTEQEKEHERIHKKQRTNNPWLNDLSSDEEEKDARERSRNVENIENNHFVNFHHTPQTNIC